MASRYTSFLDIEVAFEPSLDGGGMTFGQQFLIAVQRCTGPVDHIFEFCAGPGFIGFSLLAHHLCKRLTLADVNPAAVRACQETIARNRLEPVCTSFLSDCFAGIPDSQHWSLVVGNPPHWPHFTGTHRTSLIMTDVDLWLHRRFFRDVGSYLKPGGSILLQENERATAVADFRSMIDEGGFTINDAFKVAVDSKFYFLWCQRR